MLGLLTGNFIIASYVSRCFNPLLGVFCVLGRLPLWFDCDKYEGTAY